MALEAAPRRQKETNPIEVSIMALRKVREKDLNGHKEVPIGGLRAF